MGVLAAFSEMIVQSHHPGILAILPALPSPLRIAGGSVQGIGARGNAIVSVMWHGCGGSTCDLHGRGGVGSVTQLVVEMDKPSPQWARSEDFRVVRDTGAQVRKTQADAQAHAHKKHNVGAEISQHSLPPRSRLHIGGMEEMLSVDKPGFYQWRAEALAQASYNRTAAALAAQTLEAAGTVDDMVIVYPRSAHPLVLDSSSHSSGVSAAGSSSGQPPLSCAVPLEFSEALMKEYPALTPDLLPQILLADFVSPASRTAHFSALLVRVYRFPCKVTFSPID